MPVSWNQAFRDGAISGSLASLLSTGYLVWAGHRRGKPAAPVNAVSHWIFGDRALRADKATPRFTATGLLIHQGASMFWGVLHANAWGARDDTARLAPIAASAVVAAGVACFVDYKCTPKRLTPGFEHRLSTREMASLYGWFAVGLGVGSYLMRRTRQRDPDSCASAGRVGKRKAFRLDSDAAVARTDD